MARRILVPLAEGFEEIEAVTIVDVLRRAELEVIVAGLAPGLVRGAHGISIAADTTLDAVDPAAFDAIVLPGGMPGTTALGQDARVLAAVRSLHESGRLTAAICAAPQVLVQAGIADGVPITAHPSVRGRLAPALVHDEPRVLESGNVVTSQGAGTALEFALALVGRLCGAARRDALATAMVCAPAPASTAPRVAEAPPRSR